ncbi:OprD family porin [Trinickia sp. LjRoot230]
MTVGAGVGAAHAAQASPDEALARADQIEATPPEPSTAVLANGKHEGLIEGSHIDFEFRNYTDYLHMAGGTTRHAWVGGMQARFESGFTAGLVGLGADAALFGALKFDGGAGVGNMVHVGRNGGGSNQLAWAYPGTYDVKARMSETVLKYGLHAVSNPFLEPHDNRALPPTFLGASMLSQEWKQLALQAGSFTKVNARGHTALSGLSTSYGGVPVRRFSFVGGAWAYSPNGNAMLYAGQADDVWRQYYASIQHGIGRIEALRLTGAAGVYVTQDTGAARQGAIDNRAYGLSLSAQHGPHSLLVGYQKISSDQFFDYVNETAGDYLVNSMDVDYNAPHEQSLQLRYSFDGKYATLPGFSAMVWAQQGWGADAAAGAQRYGSGGPGAPAYGAMYLKNGQAVHGRHHEFGITPSYVVQSGRFKQTKVALIAMWHVGSAYYSDPTSQVYRLVVTLPARLL